MAGQFETPTPRDVTVCDSLAVAEVLVEALVFGEKFRAGDGDTHAAAVVLATVPLAFVWARVALVKRVADLVRVATFGAAFLLRLAEVLALRAFRWGNTFALDAGAVNRRTFVGVGGSSMRVFMGGAVILTALRPVGLQNFISLNNVPNSADGSCMEEDTHEASLSHKNKTWEQKRRNTAGV